MEDEKPVEITEEETCDIVGGLTQLYQESLISGAGKTPEQVTADIQDALPGIEKLFQE